jgi:hypothetical protein
MNKSFSCEKHICRGRGHIYTDVTVNIYLFVFILFSDRIGLIGRSGQKLSYYISIHFREIYQQTNPFFWTGIT